MNRDATHIIGDLLIQLDRVALHYHPEDEYRRASVETFLKVGYILATKSANSQDWRDAYRDALDLWKGIVNKLPYAGYSPDGSRKKFFQH